MVFSGIQKIIGAVALAALLSGAGMTLRNSTRLEVIDVRIENMAEKQSVQMGDRFTGTEAKGLDLRLSTEIERLRARILLIEATVERLRDAITEHDKLPWHTGTNARICVVEDRLRKIEDAK